MTVISKALNDTLDSLDGVQKVTLELCDQYLGLGKLCKLQRMYVKRRNIMEHKNVNLYFLAQLSYMVSLSFGQGKKTGPCSRDLNLSRIRIVQANFRLCTWYDDMFFFQFQV